MIPPFPTIDDYKRKSSDFTRIKGGLRTRGTSNLFSDPDKPLVSIITIVYNGEKHLEPAIQSVLNQTYDPIEYLIIDGGSTDGTLNIIHRYENRIAYWMSEPDHGISDAFNKGIALASGEFIGLVNADDWLSRDQIECGVAALRDSTVEFVFGDLDLHDSNGAHLYRLCADPHYARVIHSKMPDLCHPTVLAKRKAYEQIGLFDTRYRCAMDYEWFLRLHRQGGRGQYVNGLLGHMRVGGVSDASYVKALKEVTAIAIQYGQHKVVAYCLFLYRVFKGAVRRELEKHFPDALYHWLRKTVNPRYLPFI